MKFPKFLLLTWIVLVFALVFSLGMVTVDVVSPEPIIAASK